MATSPTLAVVIPVYNESANLDSLLAEWAAALRALDVPFTILAINDGSKDESGAILDRLARDLYPELQPRHRTNSGHGRACRYGYEQALELGVKWILQVDSDGQCNPAYLPSFWAKHAGADAVLGRRESRDDGFARVLVSTACRIAVWCVTGSALRDPNVPYRLLRAPVLREALTRVPAGIDMQNVAISLALSRVPGIRRAYVPIHFGARRGGENSINLRRIVAMGWQMMSDLRSVS